MVITKTKTPNQSNFFRRHIKLSAAILIVLLGVGGIFAYQKIVLELNKRSFQQARTAIDSVYTDIVHQVGPPDKYKKTKKCTYGHLEFTRGPLTCNLDITFIYGVSSEGEANAKLKAIQTVISGRGIMATKPLSQGIHESTVVNTVYRTAEDNYQLSNLNCVASYAYDMPTEISINILNFKKQPLKVSIGCYGPARQQYYPLAD